MKTWFIINTVTVWLVVIYLIIKPQLDRLEIQVERTFWEKKPYGITLMRWRYKKGSGANYGEGLFTLCWRNLDKMSDDIKKAR